MIQSLILSEEQASIRLACILVGDRYTLGCWFYLNKENSELYRLPYINCIASYRVIDIIEDPMHPDARASGALNKDTTNHIRELYDNYMESSHTEAGNKLR